MYPKTRTDIFPTKKEKLYKISLQLPIYKINDYSSVFTFFNVEVYIHVRVASDTSA